MVLSDLAKGGLESGVWIDEYNYQNKTKKELYKKYESVFSSAVYHSKNYLVSHSVIAAILSIILNISKRRKQQQQCQSNSPNATTVENYRKIVINCDQVEFYLKWRPSWKPS